MSLHPRNIEPLEGTMYLDLFFGLGKGWLSPQGGARAPSLPLCRKYLFLATGSLCTALHSPASASSLPLDCPLTLWLIPDSSVSCEQAGGFCCSLLLLFTQMNFSWFPTRACEWVAWVYMCVCVCECARARVCVSPPGERWVLAVL